MDRKYFQISLTVIAILMGMLLVDCFKDCGFGGEAAAASKHADTNFHNKVLLTASSSFEDLIEYALAKNTKGMNQALKAYEQQSAEVNKVLSTQARQEMESLVTRIKQAEQRGNNQSVALDLLRLIGY